MFNKNFFPTPEHVIEMMTQEIDFQNATILEPSAGSGNIVAYAMKFGAKVIACEIEPKLRMMLPCQIIEPDFMDVQSKDVSHITHIIMNPPFDADEKHILHAWEVSPPGASIIALCNWETLNNPYSKSRKILKSIIEQNGRMDYLGNCFSTAERKTDVEVGCIYLNKPGESREDEFAGFMMDEEEESQQAGLQRYNFVRDLVGRYIGAVKIFDKQLEYAVQMNELTHTFYKSKIGLNMTLKEATVSREEYKKDLQKSAWMHVFDKMGMQKYLTKGVKEEVNRFVETQHKIPFTMANIYNMINIVVGTQRSRMDKALEEVFNKLTMHHHENRYAVEGWKSNSHYLVNKLFIMPYMTEASFSGRMSIRYGAHSHELLEDFLKALCYILGKDYNKCLSLYNRLNHELMVELDGKILLDKHVTHAAYPVYFRTQDGMNQFLAENPEYKPVETAIWGQWFDWEFFHVKGYKKGTMHFKFKDENVWARFNQEVSRIKGYPLFEPKKGGKS